MECRVALQLLLIVLLVTMLPLKEFLVELLLVEDSLVQALLRKCLLMSRPPVPGSAVGPPLLWGDSCGTNDAADLIPIMMYR